MRQCVEGHRGLCRRELSFGSGGEEQYNTTLRKGKPRRLKLRCQKIRTGKEIKKNQTIPDSDFNLSVSVLTLVLSPLPSCTQPGGEQHSTAPGDPEKNFPPTPPSTARRTSQLVNEL